MASRRMLSKNIVDSDKFGELSIEAQALYFHLNLKADDDGFVSGPNNLIRMLGLDKTHLAELTDGTYIFIFPSGICLIRHWHMHNYIRKDRFTATIFQEERQSVHIDSRKIYMMGKAAETDEADTDKAACPTSDRQMTAQERVGENRIDKDRLDKDRKQVEVSVCDARLKKLLDNPKNDFGYKLTPRALSHYTKRMDFECIKYAIDEANISQKRSLGYVKAVLNRLIAEGVTTADKLQPMICSRHGPRVSHIDDGVLKHNYTKEDNEKLFERMDRL